MTQIVRVFNFYAREDESPAGKVALRRIDALVERVVREEWSVKRLEQYTARFVGGSSTRAGEGSVPGEQDAERAVDGKAAGVAEAEPSRGSARALVSRRDGLLMIDEDRVEHGELLPEERATLIALLEDVLTKTRHAKIRLQAAGAFWSTWTKTRSSKGPRAHKAGSALRANPVLDSPGPLPSGTDRGEGRVEGRAVDRG